MAESIRAALYARVSTSHQGQDVGLQLDELRDLAKARGWRVVGEYVDDGVSGSIRRRPQLDAMLEAVRGGQVDVVAFWKLDRLSRDARHALELFDRFRESQVDAVSPRDTIDTTTPMGRFALTMLAAFAELERANTVERVRAGVARAQAAGKHCGRPRREFDLRPAEAMLGQGHSIRETARALGVPYATLRRRLREARQARGAKTTLRSTGARP